jgi:hypothetical protein
MRRGARTGRARVRCLAAAELGIAIAEARGDHRALPWSNGPPDYALTIALRPGGARAAPLRPSRGPAVQRSKAVGGSDNRQQRQPN